MIDVTIPGWRCLQLSQLVLDFNGTLAFDGVLRQGVKQQLAELSEALTIHVVTANTYGTAGEELRGLPCRFVELRPEEQAAAKHDIVLRLGKERTAAIGNGRNDMRMLETAALGVAVIGGEGAASETLAAADIVTADISAALGLLQNPRRLIATLRS